MAKDGNLGNINPAFGIPTGGAGRHRAAPVSGGKQKKGRKGDPGINAPTKGKHSKTLGSRGIRGGGGDGFFGTGVW